MFATDLNCVNLHSTPSSAALHFYGNNQKLALSTENPVTGGAFSTFVHL